MIPKKIRDIKPGGFFTINGTVYQVATKGPVIMKMKEIDTGEPVTLDPDRSCLPLDKLSARVLIDHKK